MKFSIETNQDIAVHEDWKSERSLQSHFADVESFGTDELGYGTWLYGQGAGDAFGFTLYGDGTGNGPGFGRVNGDGYGFGADGYAHQNGDGRGDGSAFFPTRETQ